MGKIAVHFHDKLVLALQSPGEAGAIGPAQAIFLSAMQHMNGRIFRGQFIGDLARAVGGIIIHHQQIHGDRQIGQTLGHGGKILPFIKCRNNDQRIIHR